MEGKASEMVFDGHGRPINSLRLSVNRECNLRCFYCHNEGVILEKGSMLPHEIERLMKVASDLGIKKVKISGGEPLLRPDIVEIVRAISPFMLEVSLTTNAVKLAPLAVPLKDAGLKRVNASLHTIRPETYKRICGVDLLPEALEGLGAAKAAGLEPIKINMVLLNGINDAEIPEMIELASCKGAILQIIELETDKNQTDSRIFVDYHTDLKGVREWLLGAGKVVGANPLHSRERLRLERIPGGKRLPKPVEVELVMPMHNTVFCANCTRVRLTAGGFVKGCLFDTENVVDVLGPLRSGARDGELQKMFMKVISTRKPYWAETDEKSIIDSDVGGEVN